VREKLSTVNEKHPHKPTPLGTLGQWHRDPTFYREVYAQALGGLGALTVAYLFGAFLGAFRRGPALVLLAMLFALALVVALATVWNVSRRHDWKRVRPLFRVWNDDESPAMEQAKADYTRLVFSLFLTVAFGIVLSGFLFGGR
jgi:hypothetical protein